MHRLQQQELMTQDRWTLKGSGIPKIALMILVLSCSFSSSRSSAGDESTSSSEPKHATLLQDAKSVPGLLPLYQKGNKLFAELSPRHFDSEFLVLMSIARGIGQEPLLGGMTWGDDWVWSFRKVDERILVLRKNVRFRADDGTPAATALEHAYTDSVLFSLPILCDGPHGGTLVELTSIFMSDLPQIG
jgi:hypothetical protein